ncbi:hypothetical protein [Candidatus Nanohalococcus occultus]|uniref:hypothetical protein n=1 Tax=Candidatus Nanohalococcus occultus TaxID=2978047 RepID=UPI0039E1BE3D
MSGTKNEVEAWSSGWLGQELKETSDKKLGNVVRSAPYVPDMVVEVLFSWRKHYDPDFDGTPEDYDKEDPRHVENNERFRDVRERWISKTLSEAIRQGHDRIVNSYLGIIEQETGIGPIQAMLRFANWVEREAGVTYLAGHMGSGKTDFGLLMLEVFYERYKDSDKGVNVATNIKSAANNPRNPDIKFIDNQPELQRWLEGEDGYKMFLFDEASSHASGYSGDASKVTKQMRSMVRLIRKSNGSMTIIGHDGKDLHPTVRELADYVSKEAKKEAVVFEGVENREGTDKKFEVDDIPQTKWNYDTTEATDWEWAKTGENADGKPLDVIIGETYVTTGLTQEETGEIFEVKQSKVSKCKRKYEKYMDAQAA